MNDSVRLHGDDVREEQVRSELYWLAALRRDTELIVPEPRQLERSDGRLKSTVSWIDGETLATGLTEEELWSVGELAAKLHEHSERLPIPPWFDRPRWSFAALERQLPAEEAPAATQSLCLSVRSKTLHTIQRLENDPNAFCLVHGDLHLGNLLRTGQGVAAIDFADCSFSAKLRDLTIPLTSWEVRVGHTATAAEASGMEAALIAGYQSVVPLPPRVRNQFRDVLAWARSRRLLQVTLGTLPHREPTIRFLESRLQGYL